MPNAPGRLARLRPATLRTLLLTLLLVVMAGLRRPWDLRGYTGSMLALLSGRACAYGYASSERFLALLAHTPAAAERLTTTLAQWTTQLWHPERLGWLLPFPIYSDTHKKPVYSDVLVPRGRIGRTGKILGCRTLTLLHDAAGHPLLATTERGDAHLTRTHPRAVALYEAATGSFVRTSILDREGMSGDFLAALVDEQRVVVTLLKRSQYRGLDSFEEVGAFTVLDQDAQGRVLREVARARYRLAVPSRPDEPLLLNVALIRDYRRLPPPTEEAEDADAELERALWWAEDWTPMPTGRLDEPRLIALVTTGAMAQPQTLVRWYIGRWPQQENVIKAWLLPLGLDVNAGFQKTGVPNSEAGKRQERVEKRAARLAQQAATARLELTRRDSQAAACRQAASSAAALVQQVRSVDRGQAQQHAEVLQAACLAAEERVEEAALRLQQLCQQQGASAQALADLAHAPPMFELDNRKDQLMTVFKLCAANLGMWTRDQFFGADYAHCGWERLRPFFALPGQIQVEGDRTLVTLRGFNDRQLNRDLDALCGRVRERQPKLPDGTTLVFERVQEHGLTSKKYWPP